MIITVDGPSGAGKGTLCQLLAKHTGFTLLDSGALYRLTALAALREGIDLSCEEQVANIALGLEIHFKPTEQGVQVWLAGQDVSRQIREEHIGMAASKVAALTPVRKALLVRQRAFAVDGQGLIADGRDMGTVVFQEAEVKLFLTASAQERARRRIAQLEEAKLHVDPEQILRDIQERDRRDTERKTSPLIPAADAILLDSTHMDINAVFEQALSAFEHSKQRSDSLR
ncbi:(d)CMP kinase [Marinagarivorans algicola]|uniref:(d)CMP kinase n=1 Tax=Marinagarivorans algicola TaxID=1513270 RepID=UPI0006B597F0|nr:(d)CMP kinase [Marinagarivorans algicola]